MAGPGGEGGEVDAVLLVGLLDAGGPEILEDDRSEILDAAVTGLPFAEGLDEFIVFVYGEDAVGGDALNGEGGRRRALCCGPR